MVPPADTRHGDKGVAIEIVDREYAGHRRVRDVHESPLSDSANTPTNLIATLVVPAEFFGRSANSSEYE